MGVPAFYRWLSEKYPKVVQDVLEERLQVINGLPVPFDATRPNPSGVEFDNLYIDMNGIIHPCSHPENGPQPSCEEEMYENVCLYVDRLFRAMRPRKVLYLAIDGVAPRAKMNQQRARRFRSAQEARELKEIEENIRKDLEAIGEKSPPVKDAWDSNVITPGTPFMLRLSEYIRFYIRKRISEDPAWRKITVIFSDASIPGEGEHKIMDHVRLQRAQPSYNPNTVHVLHGLDADLIMLALATHEAHFYISREEVTFGRRSEEERDRRQMESGFREEQRRLDELAGAESLALPENMGKPLQRVSIPILREYLANEFAPCLDPQRLPFAPSLERLIDDIVFMCFFVGNDFLPHLPSLDIRDGALDFLFNVYKRILPGMGDYITKSGGNVNLSHVDVILAEVGAIEDFVFTTKHENEIREKQRREQQKQRQNQRRKNGDAPPPVRPQDTQAVKGRAAKVLARAEQREAIEALQNGGKRGKIKQISVTAAETAHDASNEVKKEAPNGDSESGKQKRKADTIEDAVDADDDDQEEVDALLDRENDPPKPEDFIASNDPEVAKLFKNRVTEIQQKKLDEYAKNVDDKVRLHESGWKDRYYADKCKADDVAAHGGREHLFRSYVMGLCWVMKYYYDGCPSWKWYYPFHYAPFASDLKNIERFDKDCKSFELSTPFNPVEQLMAVLPSDSVHAIPKASRWLMTDEESPIIDFYPRDVPVDPNGKAMPWLWVVLLPFIDEERLLVAMSPTMQKWSSEELLCNARGLDTGYLFLARSHSLAPKLVPVLKKGNTAKSPKTRLSDSASYGMQGFSGSVRPPLSNEHYTVEEDHTIEPPSTATKIATKTVIFNDRLENDAICVSFSEPSRLSHKSILLPGAKPLAACLTDEDKRIRRPRLSRGGGFIANLGTGNGRSDQSGYGSMNMGTYERDLANRTGRGHQMYQPGVRAWGAMEPNPKRPRGPPPPLVVGNPFMQQRRPGGPSPLPPGYGGPSQQGYQGYGGPPRGGGPPPYRGGQPPPPSGQYGGPPQQGRPLPQYAGYRGPPPPPQQHSFRNFPQQQQQRSRANPSTMNSLRAQLANTLKQHKNKNKNK